MKKIGLLGGTAWPSTIEYYRILNKLAQEHFGPSHSAKLVLSSIDYHNIRQFYPNDWEKINQVLKQEIRTLLDAKPECLLICNNTLHEGFDSIKDSMNIEIPIFHMVDLCAQKAKDEGIKKVLILGTKYTMERGYYSAKFEKLNIQAAIPNNEEREMIQNIQLKIANGDVSDKLKEQITGVLSQYQNYDAVVTACTELPIVVTSETTELKILDPMKIQCEAAFQFALN